jgi:nucleotide-binding universal stress UspA family protein
MKILLALDDSRFAEAAISALINQVKVKDREVCLLHVVGPFPVSLANKLGTRDAPDFVAARQEQRKRAEELLTGAAQELRSAGFKVTTSTGQGDARSVILDHAETWHADLIIVGSQGRKGLDRFLMGSVSEAVARHARCSVEIVRIHPAR